MSTGISMEGIIRPFVTISQRLPEAGKARVLLPGEGMGAFIAWGNAATFDQSQRPPALDITADDQCSDGLGNKQIIWPTLEEAPTPEAVSFTSGPATSGTRAEAEPESSDVQTLAQYWAANDYTISGSGDFYTVDPKTRTVTWYATLVESLQARENLNSARQGAMSGGGGGAGTGAFTGTAAQLTQPAPKHLKPKPAEEQTLDEYLDEQNYQRTGNGEFWSLDPDQKTIELYAEAVEARRAANEANAEKDTGNGTVAARPIRQPGKIAENKKAPQDKTPGVIGYNEMDRQVETITVYRPGDNDVFVNVQRILSIRFRGPDNKIHKFNMKPPRPPPRPPRGSLDDLQSGSG